MPGPSASPGMYTDLALTVELSIVTTVFVPPTDILLPNVAEDPSRNSIEEYGAANTSEETPASSSDSFDSQIKDKEGERILKKIPSSAFVFTLEIDGKKYDSVSFSRKIENLCITGNSHICFIIGGSLGLSDSVKKISNERISFSDMTFPHQLMRVILLEQVYRAFKIINNEPYHK